MDLPTQLDDIRPKKVRCRFEYGIEYLFFTPGRGHEAVEILLQNNILYARIDADFVGLIHESFMLNPLRHSSYKFFDSVLREVDADKEPEWRKFTVLRALDECELIDVANALKDETLCIVNRDCSEKVPLKQLIDKAESVLRAHGIPITKSGWFKIRLQR